MVDPPKTSSPLRLFSDEPVSKDQLGSHDAIAQTLLDIISTNGEEDYHIKKPFVVGLYGKWGSGKSSIIRMLKNKVGEKGHLRIAEVDAWSVGPKNFPRHILRSAAEEMIDDKDILNDETLPTITDIERTEESTWEINKKTLRKFRIFLGILIAVTVAIGILGYYNEVKFWSLPMEFIYAVFFGTVSTVIIYYYLPKNTKIINKSKSDLFLDDPSYFREKLSDILKTAKKTNKMTNDLCIVVDNIDRLSSREANEILSTVKTFIVDQRKYKEFKNMTFIVPCDPDQIVSNFGGGKENKEERRNEILRKYFNTTLNIPPPIWDDLEAYTRNLLKKSDLNLSRKELIEISSSLEIIYEDNPRQIKQFINNLITKHRHAQILEEDSIIEPKITDDMPMFTFFLILLSELRGEKMPQYVKELKNIQSNKEINNQKIKDFVDFRIDTWKNVSQEHWDNLLYFKNPGDEQVYKRFLIPAKMGKILDFEKLYEEYKPDEAGLVTYLNSRILSEIEIVKFLNVLLEMVSKGQPFTINSKIRKLANSIIKGEGFRWLDFPPNLLYSYLIREEEDIVLKVFSDLNETFSSGEYQENTLERYRDWGMNFINTIILDSKNLDNYFKEIDELIQVAPRDFCIVVLKNPLLDWQSESIDAAILIWDEEEEFYTSILFSLFVDMNGISRDRTPAQTGTIVLKLSEKLILTKEDDNNSLNLKINKPLKQFLDSIKKKIIIPEVGLYHKAARNISIALESVSGWDDGFKLLFLLKIMFKTDFENLNFDLISNHYTESLRLVIQDRDDNTLIDAINRYRRDLVDLCPQETIEATGNSDSLFSYGMSKLSRLRKEIFEKCVRTYPERALNWIKHNKMDVRKNIKLYNEKILELCIQGPIASEAHCKMLASIPVKKGTGEWDERISKFEELFSQNPGSTDENIFNIARGFIWANLEPTDDQRVRFNYSVGERQGIWGDQDTAKRLVYKFRRIKNN